MEPQQDFGAILQQKLQSANLLDILQLLHNATDLTINKLLTNNVNEIQHLIHTQIVDKFINILVDIQSLKQKHEDDDELFHNELAEDIGFEMPQIFPIDSPRAKSKDDENTQSQVPQTLHYQSPSQSQSQSDALLRAKQIIEPMNSHQISQTMAYIPEAFPNDLSINNEEDKGEDKANEAAESETAVAAANEIEIVEEETALSPHDQLKALYMKEANRKSQKQKIKLKLKVGTSVDIYSASKQVWLDGYIKEIKGDILCVVYGKKMKWLKKDSKQLRPKQEHVKRASMNLSLH